MTSETHEPATECLDIAWKCKRCSHLLGYGMDVLGKSHVRIRIRDQYVWVVDPEAIATTCRRCGFTNELHQVSSESRHIPVGSGVQVANA